MINLNVAKTVEQKMVAEKRNPMLPHKKQIVAIRNSSKRINILEGSVRSGKTLAFLWRWIRYVATAPEGDLALIGKSSGSLYRNIVRPLQTLLGYELNYSPGKHEVDLWGRKMFCFGAYDEGSEGIIRGMTLAGALGDELTLWPKSFFMMLLERLSVKGAQFFGSTNPDSPYHYLKTDFLDNPELSLYQEHFALEDNPSLDPEYVNNLKKEHIGLWYKRFIEGLWVLAQGAIYDFFDESIHTIEPKKLPIAYSHSVGIDYGTMNPTCFILFGEQNSGRLKCWAEDEYYHDSQKALCQKTDAEYVDDYLKFVGRIPISNVYVDPSAASFIAELKRRGVCNIRETDNSVLDGIRFQATMLKNGEYVISRKCRQVIKDYGAYSWDTKAQRNGEDRPLKQNDHTKDPERYYLYNRYGTHKIDYSALTKW
jgi:PBSX family phage terminase large subunit